MARHITGYYGFGGGSLDGEALENALRTDAHLPIESVEYAATGGGIYTTGPRNLVVGTEMAAIVDQDAGGNYDTAVGLGYGLLNVGYSVKLGPFRVIPLIGFGGGGLGLDITPIASGNAPDLSELRVSRSNFLVHIGLGIELRIGGRFGLVVGGQAGYVLAPFSGRAGIRGPYFRLMFGGNGRV
ncbi:MAG: hypothetical protein AAF125_02465 [Chloroflexota bacterium]